MTNPNKLSNVATAREVSPRATLAHYVTKHQARPEHRAGYEKGPGGFSYRSALALDAAEQIRASLSRAYFVGRSALYLGL